MKRSHLFSLGLALVGAVAVVSPSDAQPAGPKLPLDATLVKPLGFRTTPGLGGGFVFGNLNYLQPPTKVRLLSATGAMWAPNTFCQAESGGKTGYLRCDDASAFALSAPSSAPAPTSAPPSGVSEGGRCMNWSQKDPAKGLKYCTDVDSCRSFCQCACDFDASRGWTKNDETDRTTRCAPMNVSGPGLLAPGSPELKPLPSFTTLRVERTSRATQSVIDGLTRLDAIAAAAPWKSKYKVLVKSCYRPNDEDMQIDCSYTLKAAHVIKKYQGRPPANESERDSLAWAQKAQDVRKLGRAFPGANPHSGGVACDIQMLDASTNKALFDWQVGRGEATEAVRAASRALDEAVTKSGGKRLTYETWHFEWGGMSQSRCTFPDCDKYWPPTGSP